MISIHTLSPPPWIATLVDDVVLPAVSPSGFIGRFGYRVWEPGSPSIDFDGWQIATFPAPYAVRGDAHDGGQAYGAFHLDVTKIVSSFTRVEQVSWRSNANQYNTAQEFDCPEVAISGTFAGHRVRLRVFSGPPADEPVSHTVDVVHNVAIEEG